MANDWVTVQYEVAMDIREIMMVRDRLELLTPTTHTQRAIQQLNRAIEILKQDSSGFIDSNKEGNPDGTDS